MDNRKLIFAVLGGFILGYLIYWAMNKYNTSRVGTNTDTDTGVDTSTSISTSVNTSTSTGTGVPFPAETIERKGWDTLQRLAMGGDIVVYEAGGPVKKNPPPKPAYVGRR